MYTSGCTCFSISEWLCVSALQHNSNKGLIPQVNVRFKTGGAFHLCPVHRFVEGLAPVFPSAVLFESLADCTVWGHTASLALAQLLWGPHSEVSGVQGLQEKALWCCSFQTSLTSPPRFPPRKSSEKAQLWTHWDTVTVLAPTHQLAHWANSQPLHVSHSCFTGSQMHTVHISLLRDQSTSYTLGGSHTTDSSFPRGVWLTTDNQWCLRLDESWYFPGRVVDEDQNRLFTSSSISLWRWK